MNAVVVQFPEPDDDSPLLPEGEYLVAYTGHTQRFMFNTGKLFVRFRIVDGERSGARLYRAYNVKPTGRATFKTAHSSSLYREFCTLTGKRERADRLALSRLKGCVIRARVRTVSVDSKHRPLPEYLRYSVIDELCSLEAGHV